MPICVRKSGKLGWDASLIGKLSLASVLVPLEQKVHEAVFLERVVGGVFDRLQQL